MQTPAPSKSSLFEREVPEGGWVKFKSRIYNKPLLRQLADRPLFKRGHLRSAKFNAFNNFQRFFFLLASKMIKIRHPSSLLQREVPDRGKG